MLISRLPSVSDISILSISILKSESDIVPSSIILLNISILLDNLSSFTKVALPLGSCGQPCRFDPCYPHQKARQFQLSCFFISISFFRIGCHRVYALRTFRQSDCFRQPAFRSRARSPLLYHRNGHPVVRRAVLPGSDT